MLEQPGVIGYRREEIQLKETYDADEILPRKGHLIDRDVTGGVLRLRDSHIPCHQQKPLNRIEDNGVIVLDSDSDRDRAVTLLHGIGLQVQ